MTDRKATTATDRARRRRPSFGLVGQASAVIALVSAGASLYFLFRPDSKPHPRAERIAASVTRLDVEPGTTFREYLVRKNVSAGGADASLLGRVGVMLTIQWATTGLAGASLPLRWELIDETAGGEVDQEQVRTLHPDRNEDTAGILLWAALPRNSHRFHVVVTVYRPGQRAPVVFLDRKPSSSFTAPAALG